jgi:hypothetical protein
MDWTGVEWTKQNGLDWSGLDWIAMGWNGLGWNGLERTGGSKMDWTGARPEQNTGLHGFYSTRLKQKPFQLQ